MSARIPWVPSLVVALDRLSWLVPAHGRAGSRAVAGTEGIVPSFWVAALCSLLHSLKGALRCFTNDGLTAF